MISNNGIGHTWPCINKYKIKRLTMQQIKYCVGGRSDGCLSQDN
jgi:hypothetical protein